MTVFFFSVLLFGLWMSVILIMLVKTFLYLEEGSYNADAKIKAVLLGVGSLVWFAIGISTASYLESRHKENKVCLKYGHTVRYNPATKTTMPVKFCEIWGEWDTEHSAETKENL